MKIFLIALGLPILYLAFYLIRRKVRIYVYRDVMASSIQAQILNAKIINHRVRGTMILKAGGKVLICAENIALTELAQQLHEWEASVDDVDNCKEFSFYAEGEPDTAGLFRIIPRHAGWQFYSVRPFTRSNMPLSLDAIRDMARSIVEQVSFIK